VLRALTQGRRLHGRRDSAMLGAMNALEGALGESDRRILGGHLRHQPQERLDGANPRNDSVADLRRKSYRSGIVVTAHGSIHQKIDGCCVLCP
jgi:hypothetical protein